MQGGEKKIINGSCDKSVVQRITLVTADRIYKEISPKLPLIKD